MLLLMLQENTQRLLEPTGQTVFVPVKGNRSSRIGWIMRRQKITVERFEKENASHPMIKITGFLAKFLQLAGHAFKPRTIQGSAKFFKIVCATTGAFHESKKSGFHVRP